jgi:hypothetical protein
VSNIIFWLKKDCFGVPKNMLSDLLIGVEIKITLDIGLIVIPDSIRDPVHLRSHDLDSGSPFGRPE